MHMDGVEPSRSIVVPLPIPALLSFVAGYVDSCTYLALFGAYVAQLTGSFVLAGVQLVSVEPGVLVKQLAIPCFFVAGALITVLVHCLRERPRVALACSFGAEFLLLIALLACLAGVPFRGPDEPRAMVALLFGIAAMGAQSALVRLLMRGVASTNVMTTNTTMLAISATQTLLGWIASRKAGPNENRPYHGARQDLIGLLPIMVGFVSGTLSGAVAYATLGLLCLLFAILPVGALALCSLRPVSSAP
jgi:uncharacterized membrane protein YoaK (UPF0700 family)